MKTCFSERKLMKQFGNPLFLREPPPPPLSTNLPISEQFFHDRPLCPSFKNKKLLILEEGVCVGGGETMKPLRNYGIVNR